MNWKTLTSGTLSLFFMLTSCELTSSSDDTTSTLSSSVVQSSSSSIKDESSSSSVATSSSTPVSSSSQISSSSMEAEPGSSSANWQLVWEEEFEEASLDTSTWNFEYGYGDIPELNVWGWGAGQLQEYTDDSSNIYLKDGLLNISLNYDGGRLTDRNYTSSKINTKGKHTWQYGRFVIRAKLPYGKGMWPAVWMMGNEYEVTRNWPKCGEIDIIEMFGGSEDGKDNTLIGAAHWFNEDVQTDSSYSTYIAGTHVLPHPEKLADDFHTYMMEWDSTEINWYFDDTLFHTVDISASHQSEFRDDQYYLMVNNSVGSYHEAIGYPDSTNVFPQVMQLDWIKVYQKQ